MTQHLCSFSKLKGIHSSQGCRMLRIISTSPLISDGFMIYICLIFHICHSLDCNTLLQRSFSGETIALSCSIIHFGREVSFHLFILSFIIIFHYHSTLCPDKRQRKTVYFTLALLRLRNRPCSLLSLRNQRREILSQHVLWLLQNEKGHDESSVSFYILHSCFIECVSIVRIVLKEGWNSTIVTCVHKATSRICEGQGGHEDIAIGAQMRDL